MSLINSVCEKIQKELNEQCVVIRDLEFSHVGTKRSKYQIPVVIICNKALMVFVGFEDCSSERSEELRTGFRNILNVLAERLELSMNSFVFYGYSLANDKSDKKETLCSFNIYNDRINYFSNDNDGEKFVEWVLDELSYRPQAFDEQMVSSISFNLNLKTGGNGEIRRDQDGNFFVKKHGCWYLASELDPEDMFKKAVFFGAFGAHKFTENKKSVGIFYFLTCGFFGIGWLFDCLLMIAGVYRDSEGKYLLPVTNRKACFLKMLAGAAITFTYIFAYLFFIRWAGDLFNNTLNGVISSNAAKLPSAK